MQKSLLLKHGARTPASRAFGSQPICHSPAVQLYQRAHAPSQTALGRTVLAQANAQLVDDSTSPSTSTSYFADAITLPARRGAMGKTAASSVASLAPPAIALSFEDRAGIRDSAGRLMLKNLTLPELEEWCISVGEPAKRAKQLYRWLYGSRKWIRSLDQADGDPHSFSASFKGKVASSASLSGGLQLQSVHTARDGTRKLVFALVDEASSPAAAAGGGEQQAQAVRHYHEGEDGDSHQHQHQQEQTGREGVTSAAAASSSGAGAGAGGGSGRVGGAPNATRGTVETVLIPMTNRSGQNLRYTACLSTQVGCAMNCQFCYTGRMGLLGNLSTAQIIEQVVEARRYLADQGVDIPIANIVFMGMGEPLHNYDAVMAAIEILAVGLELSRNKIIVSTVGLVPEMVRFIESKAAKLAVSLHATTDEVRDWIVPTNRRYPLDELLGALRRAFPYDAANRRNSNGKSDDFVVIEYVLLSGVNDSVQDAERLVALTADIYCIVNLIVFNPHEGTAFQRSTDEAVRAFRGVFATAGRLCTVRTSKGDDEMAACGQLGDVALSSRPAPLLRPPEGLAERLAALRQQQQQQAQAQEAQQGQEAVAVA